MYPQVLINVRVNKGVDCLVTARSKRRWLMLKRR